VTHAPAADRDLDRLVAFLVPMSDRAARARSKRIREKLRSLAQAIHDTSHAVGHAEKNSALGPRFFTVASAETIIDIAEMPLDAGKLVDAADASNPKLKLGARSWPIPNGLPRRRRKFCLRQTSAPAAIAL
jgi:hypothetical protein